MKVAVIILSILVLAAASESIEEYREDFSRPNAMERSANDWIPTAPSAVERSADFAVEELERATCAGQDKPCKETCDCCGERGECVCALSYEGKYRCICRQGYVWIAWYKLASCKK
uniref:U2-ctenitoxin-Pn1b n=1 Tax=Phoneutria nigriventer TaxID=6918 RepID=TX34B_PHONI|nr:RecName: Full=U2-ctenitoxin-Pn1b; Short=U2-CNTX-Pn1b; AltName: Full=Neurotoxin Pn2-1A; Flags: Precursor [Phoneutria nigriventer]AAC26164.1 neurotoxic protein [Phoneutria nigriventer]